MKALHFLLPVAIFCLLATTACIADVRRNHFGEGERFDKSNGYEDISDTSLLLPDLRLPRARNQGGTQLCQTFCAAALMQIEYCMQKRVECRSLTRSEEISPISLLMYRDFKFGGRSRFGGMPPPVESGSGATYRILDNIAAMPGKHSFYSEGCIPFEAYQARIGSTLAANKKLFADLERDYSAAHMALKTLQRNNCPLCVALVAIMRESLGTRIDLPGILRALNEPDFERFLIIAIFEEGLENNPECREVVFDQTISFDHYPKRDFSKNARPTSMMEAFEVLRMKLKEGRAVSVEGLCYAQDLSDRSCYSHCVVVTGIKQVRRMSTGETIELVRVLNSWGTVWHDATNGGWLRLDLLQNLIATSDDSTLEKRAADRARLFANTFSWVKDTNKPHK